MRLKKKTQSKPANYQRNGAQRSTAKNGMDNHVLKVGTEPAILTADPISFDQLQSIFLFP